jgi:hypothetical protein
MWFGSDILEPSANLIRIAPQGANLGRLARQLNQTLIEIARAVVLALANT